MIHHNLEQDLQKREHLGTGWQFFHILNFNYHQSQLNLGLILALSHPFFTGSRLCVVNSFYFPMQRADQSIYANLVQSLERCFRSQKFLSSIDSVFDLAQPIQDKKNLSSNPVEPPLCVCVCVYVRKINSFIIDWARICFSSKEGPNRSGLTKRRFSSHACYVS